MSACILLRLGLGLGCLALGLHAAAGAETDADSDAGRAEVLRIVDRYLEARGGAESWRSARSLEIRGIYAAFSDYEPFTLIRGRDDLYRLDFAILGGPAVRARDAAGPWWRHPLLSPEPARLGDGPYRIQVEREAHFAPLLLDFEKKGIAIEWIGPGEVDGLPTLELRLTLPDGAQESWHLDSETGLEVAVDSQVHDFTQSGEPMRQRVFYDDFRDVSGLVIPFSVEYEFGHRLERMQVEEVRVNGEIDPTRFSPPEAAEDSVGD